MTTVILVTLTGVLSLISGIAVFSQKHLALRWCAVVLSTALIAGLPLSMWELLSRPKPVEREFFRDHEEVELLAEKAVEGQYLYLWVKLPEENEPRYYSLPWFEGGKELKKGIDDAREKHPGAPIILQFLFEPSFSKEKNAYPMPPPVIERKTPEEEVPEFPA